jgi:hypothetical protein
MEMLYNESSVGKISVFKSCIAFKKKEKNGDKCTNHLFVLVCHYMCRSFIIDQMRLT